MNGLPSAPDALSPVPLPDPLREYVSLRRGPGQLVAFVALLAGAKPVLDDWVDARDLDTFMAFARRLGLFAVVNAYFGFIADPAETDEIIGGSQLNTTRARGYPPWHAPTGAAHVFLARDQRGLDAAVAHGWYPLAIDGRVVDKPWIDHFHFGHHLGYPECCRRFFARHNDWNHDNNLYQAFRRTKSASYLCNSLLKHSGLSYSVHLPCSFDCPASLERARAVRDAVIEVCPDLAAYVDEQLRRPYVVLSEWDAFRLDGTVTPAGRVNYSAARAVPSNRPNKRLGADLSSGDGVEIEGDVVRIYQGSSVISTYQAVSDRYGPEVPFVVDFAG
ncbi:MULTISPECIES: hypothetical protein [Pseudofrankia]|uniref:hypothetical protein n=1 Tax=Pseudofrankia TaxID=2994363 RepID=UPI000234C883|nr:MULTISPECIES: hypothetical protein [Pseudofrankia]OHV37120.1 hypothetical protein BCD49_18250 [Pseudofrankia sp. EUN1h]